MMNAEEALFNSQLIQRFFTDYDLKGYASKLPAQIYDRHQAWSSNELRIASQTPKFMKLLSSSCLTGRPFPGRIKTRSDLLDESTYLFQLGVTTLSDTRVEYDPDVENFQLTVPNRSVRQYYVEDYREFLNGRPGSTHAFVVDPSEDKLQDCLDQLVKSYPWTNEQTEADLKVELAHDFVISPNVRVGSERAPASEGKKRTDIQVVTDQDHFILEAKTVKAAREDSKNQQTLKPHVIRQLGLTTTGRDQYYPKEGLDQLGELNFDELFTLETNYNGTKWARTVAEVHQQATVQALAYATTESEYQVRQKKPLRVFACATTQVVNRCYATLIRVS